MSRMISLRFSPSQRAAFHWTGLTDCMPLWLRSGIIKSASLSLDAVLNGPYSAAARNNLLCDDDANA